MPITIPRELVAPSIQSPVQANVSGLGGISASVAVGTKGLLSAAGASADYFIAQKKQWEDARIGQALSGYMQDHNQMVQGVLSLQGFNAETAVQTYRQQSAKLKEKWLSSPEMGDELVRIAVSDRIGRIQLADDETVMGHQRQQAQAADDAAMKNVTVQAGANVFNDGFLADAEAFVSGYASRRGLDKDMLLSQFRMGIAEKRADIAIRGKDPKAMQQAMSDPDTTAETKAVLKTALAEYADSAALYNMAETLSAEMLAGKKDSVQQEDINIILASPKAQALTAEQRVRLAQLVTAQAQRFNAAMDQRASDSNAAVIGAIPDAGAWTSVMVDEAAKKAWPDSPARQKQFTADFIARQERDRAIDAQAAAEDRKAAEANVKFIMQGVDPKSASKDSKAFFTSMTTSQYRAMADGLDTLYKKMNTDEGRNYVAGVKYELDRSRNAATQEAYRRQSAVLRVGFMDTAMASAATGGLVLQAEFNQPIPDGLREDLGLSGNSKIKTLGQLLSDEDRQALLDVANGTPDTRGGTLAMVYEAGRKQLLLSTPAQKAAFEKNNPQFLAQLSFMVESKLARENVFAKGEKVTQDKIDGLVLSAMTEMKGAKLWTDDSPEVSAKEISAFAGTAGSSEQRRLAVLSAVDYMNSAGFRQEMRAFGVEVAAPWNPATKSSAWTEENLRAHTEVVQFVSMMRSPVGRQVLLAGLAAHSKEIEEMAQQAYTVMGGEAARMAFKERQRQETENTIRAGYPDKAAGAAEIRKAIETNFRPEDYSYGQY